MTSQTNGSPSTAVDTLALQPTPTKETEETVAEGFVWYDDLKNVRILVVDDSFPILKMISTNLKEYGAVITQARDGQEAISRCELAVAADGKDFDLILTDIQMPNMDGLTLVQLIRSMEKELGLASKIIVGISAYSGDRIGIDALEAGMDAFLPKPFKYETFESTVLDIIHRRKNVAFPVCGSENGVMTEPDSASTLKPLQQPLAGTPSLGSRRIAPEA